MTGLPLLTRRQTVAALLGALASGASATLPAMASGRIAKLHLSGPPATPSLALAHGVKSGLFSTISDAVTFKPWRSPDELRAGLTSGEMDISVVPVQAAANLYNRGFPIRLANVMTNGLLFVLAEDPGINTIADLKGRRVSVPFRGDTPEIIFAQLLRAAGLDAQADLEIRYAGTPIEAMQLLLAGRVDAALTAEPAASAAIIMARKLAGKTLRRAIDLQDALAATTGASGAIPQAGLALTGRFLDQHPDVVAPLLAGVTQAMKEVIARPEEAAANGAAALGLPAPVIAASIPKSRLVARPAREARADIEAMLGAMAEDNADVIAGALPDDGFYL